MTAPFIEQLFFEIAMSLGNSPDMETMLRQGLSTYLRKLNCLAGEVLQFTGDDEIPFESRYRIPRRLQPNSAVFQALKHIQTITKADGLTGLQQQLPVNGQVRDQAYSIMELPNFGLLILVVSENKFSDNFLKSLTQLNAKLAQSCISCKQNEQLNREIEIRKQAEEKYRGIFNNAVEGIYQTSLDGSFINVNPAMARLLGYDSPQDLIQNIPDAQKDLYADPDQREALLDKLNQDGQLTGFEARFKKKNGDVIHASISARLIVNEEGIFTIDGTFEDITARIEREKAERAKEAAEAAALVKSQFLAGMSHEIRTPMNAVLGAAELLEDTDLDEEQQKYLKLFKNAGSILMSLINDILDLAKIESGKIRLENLCFNPARVLLDTADIFQNQLDQKGLEQHIILPEDLPKALVGDPHRLKQILINLTGNAVKFTSEGSITLSVGRTDPADETSLLFCVKDTGIGIPEEQLPLIFKRFTQADTSITRKYGGTGLGLAISKELVALMDGKIWAESEPGSGTSFFFTAKFQTVENGNDPSDLFD